MHTDSLVKVQNNMKVICICSVQGSWKPFVKKIQGLFQHKYVAFSRTLVHQKFSLHKEGSFILGASNQKSSIAGYPVDILTMSACYG